MHAVYYGIMLANPDSSFVGSSSEGKKRVLTTPKSLYLGGTYTAVGDPRFVTVPVEESYLDHLGFAFAKNSEFTRLFNYHLQKLEESGLMKKLRTKWEERRPADDGGSDEASPLGYDLLVGPFLMLVACGFILPITLVVLEGTYRLLRYFVFRSSNKRLNLSSNS